jgi:glycosyltransferase involved in cell wall biosynthesis
MTKAPKISVCMPTCNQSRYIRDALQSVLRQTIHDFEIVVFDDASTDDTAQVVSSIRDPRIRYFCQQRRVGIASNRNSCLAVAAGRYIAWLDSDDIYHPPMLALQSAVLDRHPNVGLAHGAYEVIAEDGRRLPDWPLPFEHDVIENGNAAFRELILSNYITAPTVMVRRECHEHAGPYASEIGKTSTDWDMWLRISLHRDLAYTSTPLAKYRQHPASVSATNITTGGRVLCDIAAVQRIFTRLHTAIADVRILRRKADAALAAKTLIACGDAFKTGSRSRALSMAVRAFRLVPDLLLRNRHGVLLLLGLLRSHEYAVYRHSKSLMGVLYDTLAGSRFSQHIRKTAVVNPQWEETLLKIAETVRRLVPEESNVAVVDKYDPTIMHLSGRKGWHFPDGRLLPGGYPSDDGTAIDHLEQIRQLGASHIVFPSAAFWWLDHYKGFRQHLEMQGQRTWADESCIIYEIGEAVTAR